MVNVFKESASHVINKLNEAKSKLKSVLGFTLYDSYNLRFKIRRTPSFVIRKFTEMDRAKVITMAQATFLTWSFTPILYWKAEHS